MEWSRADRVLRIRPLTFWSDADLQAFECELRRYASIAIAAAGSRPVRLLVDVRDSELQSQATIAAIKALVAAVMPPDYRVAVVAAGLLQRAQATRINETPNNAAFADEQAARHWLTSA